MSDVVERLRGSKCYNPQNGGLCSNELLMTEAADEIERLREALEIIACGEGCMNGMREELDAATLRKLATAALKGNQ